MASDSGFWNHSTGVFASNTNTLPLTQQANLGSKLREPFFPLTVLPTQQLPKTGPDLRDTSLPFYLHRLWMTAHFRPCHCRHVSAYS